MVKLPCSRRGNHKIVSVTPYKKNLPQKKKFCEKKFCWKRIFIGKKFYWEGMGNLSGNFFFQKEFVGEKTFATQNTRNIRNLIMSHHYGRFPLSGKVITFEI